MIVDFKRHCVSLGLEYDEESIQSTDSVYTTESLRKHVAIVERMKADVERELTRIGKVAPLWSETRSHKSPVGEQSAESLGDVTPQQCGGETRPSQQFSP